MSDVGSQTVWKGSVLSKFCGDSDSEIVLLHNRFMTPPSKCNNDTIVIQGVRIENNSYTSQLKIIVSCDLLGDDVVCTHNHNGTTDVIGNTTILNSITSK